MIDTLCTSSCKLTAGIKKSGVNKGHVSVRLITAKGAGDISSCGIPGTSTFSGAIFDCGHWVIMCVIFVKILLAETEWYSSMV